MKLQLYFARKFLRMMLGIFLGFAAFLTMLDMVEQVRRFDAANITLFDAFRLSLLTVPETLYSILPLVVMLATLALFLSLSRTSELVVTRAAGRSAIRAMVAPALAAAVVGVLAVTVFNPIVATTKRVYEQRVAGLSGQDGGALSVSREGLWLRQGGAEGQTVIRAARGNLDGTTLYNVSFVTMAPEDSEGTAAVSRIQAQSATLVPGMWKLTDAKIWPLDVPNPETAATFHAAYDFPSPLTQERIRDSFGEPAAVPIWELPAFIRALDSAGFSARKHRVWFQMELAQPLFLAAMVMIGAGFTMRHTRSTRTGLMVLFALLFGFSAFFIRNLAQVLGQNGDIPVLLAAWAPPFAAALLSLGLLLHLEDG